MRRTVALAAGLAALALFLVVPVPRGSAFDLTTCTLTLTSVDADGFEIATAWEGGPIGSTRDNPFEIDPGGTIQWEATTGGTTLMQASYHVEVYGIPTPLSGSMAGDSTVDTSSGEITVADILPLNFVGTAYVSGAVHYGGSTYCEGSGWIRVRGDPIGTPGFAVATAMSLLGLAGMLAGMRGRHPILGTLAGLVFGAGIALLSGTTGILPLDEKTPIAEIIGSVVLGLALGVIDFGSLFGGGRGSVVVQPGAGGAAAAVMGPPPGPAAPLVPPPSGGPLPPWVAPGGAAGPPAATPPAPPFTAGQAAGPIAPVPPPPNPGLEAVRGWKNSLPPEQQAVLDPLFPQAEYLLHGHPGTMTIGSNLVERFLEAAQSPVSAQLGEGAISLLGGFVEATPSVVNGRLAISFQQDLVGRLVSKVGDVTGALDGLNWFVDQVNLAVANAGQHITSVVVTPEGISITTAAQ